MAHEPRPEPAALRSKESNAAPPAANGPGPEAAVPAPVPLDPTSALPPGFAGLMVRPMTAGGVLLSRGELEAGLRQVWFPNLTSLRPLDPAGEEYLVRLQQPAADGGA